MPCGGSRHGRTPENKGGREDAPGGEGEDASYQAVSQGEKTADTGVARSTLGTEQHDRETSYHQNASQEEHPLG